MRPMRAVGLVVTLIALTSTGPAAAGDIDDASFGLRMQAALTRFSRYPDVAGTGGASAAAMWGSSVNPAATAWLGMDGASVQYSRIAFSEGTELDMVSASYAFNTENWGGFQPSLAWVDSNRATTRDGLDFEYSAGFVDLQWAIGLREGTAVGVNLGYAGGDMKFAMGGVTLAKSDSQSWTIRIGGLHELVPAVRVGLALEYAANPSRTRELALPGPDHSRDSDTAHQYLIRPGVAWEYAERSRVYVDYQAGYFTDDTGRLRVHRFYAGVDQMVLQPLAIRVGGVVDTEGNRTFTAGLGFFPSEHVFIDLAYQYDMFPEVKAEFGRSQTLGLSLSVAF